MARPSLDTLKSLWVFGDSRDDDPGGSSGLGRQWLDGQTRCAAWPRAGPSFPLALRDGWPYDTPKEFVAARTLAPPSRGALQGVGLMEQSHRIQCSVYRYASAGGGWQLGRPRGERVTRKELCEHAGHAAAVGRVLKMQKVRRAWEDNPLGAR